MRWNAIVSDLYLQILLLHLGVHHVWIVKKGYTLGVSSTGRQVPELSHEKQSHMQEGRRNQLSSPWCLAISILRGQAHCVCVEYYQAVQLSVLCRIVHRSGAKVILLLPSGQ